MKNLILITFILLTILPACELVTNSVIESESVEVGRIEDYDFENDIEVTDYKDACAFTCHYIKYTNDPKDYWQTPEESCKLKTGDCEDYALFYSFLLDTKLHINSEIIIYHDSYNNNKLHVITYIPSEDRYMDATCNLMHSRQNNEILESRTKYRVPYYEAIWMTINYHEIVGKYDL